jgi:hypothetical protein
MKELIWLIPLVPLAGFLINGLVHLIGGRPPKTERGSDAHGTQAAAESSKELGHPHAHTHEETLPRWRAFHTAVGLTSVGLSMVLAFGAIFDIGLGALSRGATHAVTLYHWIPLGVNQAVGQIPGPAREWSVDVAFRVDALSALMLAFVTFVGFVIHVYSVGYMGHDRG